MTGNKTKPTKRRSLNPLTSHNLQNAILFLPIDDPNWSPIWDSALATFMGFERSGLGWRWSGKHDSTLLAEALVTQASVPETVRAYLSCALKPNARWTGPVLSLNASNNESIQRQLAEVGRKLAIVEEYAAQKDQKIKTEAIAADICNRFGIERSYFFQIKKMPKQAIRDEFLALLDPRSSIKS